MASVAEPRRHRLRLALGGGRVREPDGQLDQAPERRRAEPLAQRQLGVVEGGPVAARRGGDGRVVGLVGLEDRAAGPLAAAGPADRLDQQLVGPFRGALVGQVERDVRRDDADQRDRRDVEALGDEARPDEDVEPAVAEGVDDAFGRAAMLDDVAVQPPDAEPREGVADLALDAFRATAEVADAGRLRRPGSGSRAASPGRSGGSAGSCRPGGRRAAARSPGRPGRGRSRGTGRSTRSRGG